LRITARIRWGERGGIFRDFRLDLALRFPDIGRLYVEGWKGSRNDNRRISPLRFSIIPVIFTANLGIKGISSINRVSVYRTPHLLCCRALEVQGSTSAYPPASHLQHPVNA
jgi:hypothetical protein